MGVARDQGIIKIMIRYYFDTSAINALFSDRDKDRFIKYFSKTSNRVYLSSWNVLEIGATSDPTKRKNLLELACQLTSDFRPLAFPRDILRRTIEAYQQKRNKLDISIDSKDEGLWVALNDPDLLDEEAVKEAKRTKSEEEAWHRDVFTKMRNTMQSGLEKFNGRQRKEVPRDPSALLKHFYSNQNILENFFSTIFQLLDYGETFKGKETKILDDLESWRFFWGAYAISMFDQTMRVKNYRCTPKKGERAGNIDLQQSIYLAFCDFFITNDGDQNSILRRLAVTSKVNKKVISLKQLKKKI